MKKKIFLAAALAAVTLLAACGEPEEKTEGNNTGTSPTAAPAITAAPTDQSAQPTAAPAASTPTEAPASNTAAPASNTAAPASNTAAPASNTAAPASNTAAPASNTAAPASNTTAPAANTSAPTASTATSKPVQAASNFDAIAGSWYSAANDRHGNLSLQISSDGSSSLGTLAYDGNDSYHVVGTTTTLSLEKWADGSERLYIYDTYTYEDATYTRSN